MSILVYGGDCSMSTMVMREELVRLGPVHTLDIFTEELSSDTEQVRLRAVPSYSGVVEGEMVRVSWGGGTNTRECSVTIEH